MEDRARVLKMRRRVPSLLLAAVLVLLTFLLGYLLLSSYRNQLRTAEIGTHKLATLLETQLYETLRRTDADLLALSSEIPPSALNAKVVSQYQQDIHARLLSRGINANRMNGIHVFDGNGVALYSSYGVPAPALNISDSAYFRTLRDDPGAGLAFASVVKSGFSGKDILVVARGIRDQGGVFMGVVLSPMNLTFLKRQFETLKVGEQGVVVLRRADNHSLVIRWPEGKENANKPLTFDNSFAKTLATDSVDVTESGESRVTSLKKMPAYPFYFAIGLDRGEVLSGWYAQVLVVGLVLLMVIGLAGVLILRLGRMRVREAVMLTDLAQSEPLFGDLARLVPVGICRFDPSGKCTFVNERYRAMTGRSKSELIGSEWSAFVHADDRGIVRDAWNSMRSNGEACFEYRLARPNGEIVNMIGEAKAEQGIDRVVSGYIVAQTDFSQQKKVEAELIEAKHQAEQANQAKTRFLAAASHDLRQPIQAINLFKDALSRAGLNDEQKTIAQFLSQSVRSLSDLLYSLLDFSKLEAGLVQPQMRRVEVEDIFKAVDDEFSSLAQQKKLRFKFFYPSSGLAFHSDQGLLLSVLRNLIDNAFKYTSSGGVLVGVRKRGGQGVVQVWDTGMGISPGVGEKVFEECFQVGNALRDRTQGLGIGLSIARRTARLLGGDVIFHSRLGKGSVFEIYIPLVVDSSESAKWPSTHNDHAEAKGRDIDCSRFSGWRVVVVEDDPVVAKSIELSLQALDIEVDIFCNAEEAMASPSLLGGDFYISDLILPGKNGIQLLDAIQERSAFPIRAVLMTGETSPDRMEIISASRWRVLLKPADLSRILSIMGSVVDG